MHAALFTIETTPGSVVEPGNEAEGEWSLGMGLGWSGAWEWDCMEIRHSLAHYALILILYLLLRYEDHGALDGGDGGLHVTTAILEMSRHVLKRNG